MRIQIGDLIKTLAPEQVVIEIESSSFTVNDLTVGEVLTLDALSEEINRKYSDEAMIKLIDFLAGLFKDGVPAALTECKASLALAGAEKVQRRRYLLNQATLIAATLNVACGEIASQKKSIEAEEEVRNRVVAATASDS